MQTFLPYSDFGKSARVLDNKRLNKQIIECFQILKAITNPTYGWQNHPIVNMWRGYPLTLSEYMLVLDDEYYLRTNKQHRSALEFYIISAEHAKIEENNPPWIGYKPFHYSHKMNLIRKDSIYLAKFLPELEPEPGVYSEQELIDKSQTTPYLWFDSTKQAWYITNKGRRTYV